VKILYRAILLLSLLWLTACESVFVEQPLGEEVVVLEEALWQGQWTNGEIVITTTVIDAEKGILQAAWLERGQQGAEMEMATGYVRKTGELVYLNLPNYDGEEATGQDSESPMKPSYHWARLAMDEHRALLWWPSQQRFRDAVTAGKLPGTIKEDQDVLLGELSAGQLEMINAPEANLLNWTEPLVLVRIAD
jgi:hypothetical protein